MIEGMLIIAEIILTTLAILIIWAFLTTDKKIVKLGNKIPGPPSLPFVGNSLTIPTTGPGGLKYRREMVKKYGHTTRLWLGNYLFVFLSDPEDCEVILRSNKHLTKSSLIYNFLHRWLGTGLLTSTEEKWHARRKAITPTFHFQILEQFIKIFDKNGDLLINCLKLHSNGEAFNVQPFISKYTLDIICESAMGTEVNAQIDHNSIYVSAVRKMCDLISDRIRKRWLFSDVIYFLTGRYWQEKKLLEILHGQTNKVIQEKTVTISQQIKKPTDNDIHGLKEKTAFLELLLKMKMSGNPAFQTDNDIKEEVNTFMFEGHDTTTSAICFTLVKLSEHKEVQEKIYKELVDLLETRRNLSSYESLKSMKYLECVIKESLRLYPSVPVIGRELFEDTHLPSGYTVPAGSTLLISMYFVHRNEKYFSNPEEFNPANFLPENMVNRHPYAYIPFSAGPRNCIGQKFAMLELQSVLSKIILNYIIEAPNDCWRLVEDPNIVFQSVTGHKIALRPRNITEKISS